MNFPFMCSIIPAVPACGAYHISIHMIFQSCWFLLGRVLDRRFAANKEATEHRVHSWSDEVITTPQVLGWPL
jgi:hypothetical protein